MPYRNKTFVSFASETLSSYRLMQAWKANQHIEFDFYDAHDLNTARDTSSRETIERRLTERLANTKQVVMLIGDQTKAKADDGFSFVHHEVTVIKKLGLPIIFVNLNQSRTVQANRLPTALSGLYTMSVSFQPKIIKFALDDFILNYPTNLKEKSGPHHYLASVYSSLGL